MANEAPETSVSDSRAQRYERLKLTWHMVELGLGAVALMVFYFSGASRELAAFASHLNGNAWLTVAVYVAIVVAAAAVLMLPVGFLSGYWLEHKYDLSNQSFGSWCWDEAKGLILSLIMMTIVAEAVYALLRVAGPYWWIWTTVFLSLLSLVLGFLLPIVFVPMFYKLVPLEDVALAEKLRTMAERAGARVLGVFRIDLSAKTKKANAAFAGFGRTRRILLGDTLLSNFSQPEIEVVLAHELAHFRHHDIWKGMAIGAIVTAAGLWFSNLWLRIAVGDNLADVAHLPVLAMAVAVFSLITSPFTHAWSRRQEYRADWFALELTRDPESFESAMRKLAGQNLANLEPNPVVEFFFYDHPALAKRIAKATLWRQASTNDQTAK